jgi:hypothetical protein
VIFGRIGGLLDVSSKYNTLTIQVYPIGLYEILSQ